MDSNFLTLIPYVAMILMTPVVSGRGGGQGGRRGDKWVGGGMFSGGGGGGSEGRGMWVLWCAIEGLCGNDPHDTCGKCRWGRGWGGPR